MEFHYLTYKVGYKFEDRDKIRVMLIVVPSIFFEEAMPWYSPEI